MFNYLCFRGKRNRILFTQVEKYVIEMTGFQRGAAIKIGSVPDIKDIEAFPIEDGPYIHRNMDVKSLGFKGKVSHFHVLDDTIVLHLVQAPI